MRFESTETEEDVPRTRTEEEVSATRVTDRHLSIYWRMLRPEFVKGDADTTAYRVRDTSAGVGSSQACACSLYSCSALFEAQNIVSVVCSLGFQPPRPGSLFDLR